MENDQNINSYNKYNISIRNYMICCQNNVSIASTNSINVSTLIKYVDMLYIYVPNRYMFLY